MATTQWSRVLAARDGSGPEARRALEELCRAYWQPLYAYIRRRGAGADEARDLTQGYFTHLFEKHALDNVDPAKGRFRAFLLASLHKFLSHERERAQTLKRGGGAVTIPLDGEKAEARHLALISSEKTPEEAFEHRWALAVIDRAMVRLAKTFEATDDATRFQHLRPYLTSAESQLPYAEAALTLEMTEGAVKTAVHRLRKRFGDCLRAEVSETVADPDQVDDELRHLLATVRPAGA